MKYFLLLPLIFVVQMVNAGSLEDVGLAYQIVYNIYGLANDLRSEADRYKFMITTEAISVPNVKTVMNGNSDSAIKRIQWISDLESRNSVGISSALAVYGLRQVDIDSMTTVMKTVAQNVKVSVTLSTQDIATQADVILNNVPKFEHLW